jgi:rhodanese-related sulfurtransferase
VKTLAPAELARRRAAGEEFLLLDVREPFETAICRIEGSLLVPMSDLRARVDELDPERPIVCVCHHGIRSAQVAGELARLGFEEVYNLAGGIERWAVEVDRGMRRY